MNLHQDFFQMSKLSEGQEKRSAPEMKHLFPRIQVKTKKKVFTKNETLFSRIQVKTKEKKRSSPGMEHFFPPNSSTDLRSDTHQSQIIGGDAGEDHTQLVGEDTVKLLGWIYPPPRVSAPLVKAV